MYIGFDYGTANCAVAVMENGQPRLLPLEGDSFFIPSTLAAPSREAVSEALFRHYDIKPADKIGEQLLRRSISANKDDDIIVDAHALQFGQQALDTYLNDPDEVYYVKSPKSFLGASGLHDIQLSLFEDLVCAMMANIKHRSENQCGESITQAVIGRPVNFQGTGGSKANQQAESILRRAATRAGFKAIEFQFEPVAAGLEYESQLQEDKTVLVVDIGGGTTDCSVLQMGPGWLNKEDRTEGLLAHSGSRVGGNDLDIALAFERIMPLFGKHSTNQRGLAAPISQFWNPVAINNVAAQSDFYASANLAVLQQLVRDSAEPALLQRLLQVYHHTLGHQLVREAELLKIALSESSSASTEIRIGQETLPISCTSHELAEAVSSNAEKISSLINEALSQAECAPDVIFMTGGSARSPMLRQLIEQRLPGVPIVAGDYFGSVTAGLSRWAEFCFR
ncbi:molecular chaperone [Photobacterium sp. WH77]|uniref:molecular chaperone n=1 Tax=Photobacterium TaxID=657 RepID=UPI001C466438|nr:MULTISPECIES: molecular chaperone [Photobacterium]MBV7263073.1 molecular chaperone [Photobacterium sp. WH24]MCG2837648.1 molecular chaperone [Photobacterium sp. WH77]MCG2845264.1 molecular chaperone [Photobacterium sp. WH80]